MFGAASASQPTSLRARGSALGLRWGAGRPQGRTSASVKHEAVSGPAPHAGFMTAPAATAAPCAATCERQGVSFSRRAPAWAVRREARGANGSDGRAELHTKGSNSMEGRREQRTNLGGGKRELLARDHVHHQRRQHVSAAPPPRAPQHPTAPGLAPDHAAHLALIHPSVGHAAGARGQWLQRNGSSLASSILAECRNSQSGGGGRRERRGLGLRVDLVRRDGAERRAVCAGGPRARARRRPLAARLVQVS